jgi:hypothetical protein
MNLELSLIVSIAVPFLQEDRKLIDDSYRKNIRKKYLDNLFGNKSRKSKKVNNNKINEKSSQTGITRENDFCFFVCSPSSQNVNILSYGYDKNVQILRYSYPIPKFYSGFIIIFLIFVFFFFFVSNLHMLLLIQYQIILLAKIQKIQI